uniref:Uncharacterized protein n=1 Tax=Corethron hystrix TaxID=216773 RepID=A0A7S1BM06_9STRA|mmetsp:Transcript_33737/g.77867  ORF Transcript_33737/g.77867 Transcript_33737/m.77867 type:complete len:173 (+) Transcript_33737:1075-1593(+)
MPVIRFHFLFLIFITGKTPLDSNKEWDLLNHDKSYPLDSERIYRLKNLHKMMKNEKRKIFLFDIAQLEDSDAARLKTFRDDFHQFLDIEDDLLDLPHRSTGRHEDMAKSILAKQINICDNEHNKVRKVLMRIGRNASAWIRKYFLLSEDVTVSSRKYFKEIIKKWRHDPCFS